MEYLPHYAATIDKVIAHSAPLPEVEAILLAGSIAHGFARHLSRRTQTPSLLHHWVGQDPDRLTMIKTDRDWPQPWPAQFMQDSELNWRHGFTPVDDL